ncbi:MAG: hypothetical protein M0C28_13895 [Candidatus Moduliflexus flocculans]|nr:hypothetical protein [Candidatus Moduliflexus flocculans]
MIVKEWAWASATAAVTTTDPLPAPFAARPGSSRTSAYGRWTTRSDARCRTPRESGLRSSGW